MSLEQQIEGLTNAVHALTQALTMASSRASGQVSVDKKPVDVKQVEKNIAAEKKSEPVVEQKKQEPVIEQKKQEPAAEGEPAPGYDTVKKVFLDCYKANEKATSALLVKHGLTSLRELQGRPDALTTMLADLKALAPK